MEANPDKLPMTQWLTKDPESGSKGPVGPVLVHFRDSAEFAFSEEAEQHLPWTVDAGA